MAVNISLTVLSPAERLGHWARLTGFWPYGSAQHRQSTRMDEYSSGRSMAVLPVGDAAADLYGSRWSGIHGPSRVRRSMRSVPTTTTGAEDDSTAGLRAWPPTACSLLSDRGSRVSIMSIGISVAAHSWFGRYGFWLGILVVIGGLLPALADEIGYRRARSGPPPDTRG
jgi:hypothetical protein